MRSPRGATFSRIFRFLEVGFFVGAILVVASLVTGKVWLERHFLRQEVHLGDGSLRVYGGKLYWDLQVLCDSARYDSPTLQVRSGKALIYITPLRHFLLNGNLADVLLDTVFIRLKSNPNALPVHKPTDSLTFPPFKIPVKIALSVRAFTLANDSGVMGSAWKIHVRNPGSEEIVGGIGTLTSPYAGGLRCSLSTHLDWSAADSISLDLKLLREKDQIHLTTRQPKAALLKGQGSLQIEALDSRPYTTTFGLEKKKNPFAQAIHLDVNVDRNDSLEAHVFLQARVSGFSNSPPIILSPQKLEIRMDGSNHLSRWQIKSQGEAGEAAILNGEMKEISTTKEKSLLPLWYHYAASVQGSAEKVRVRAKKKILLTGVRLEKVQWNGQVLSAILTTDDTSRIRAQGRQTHGNWTGEFSVHVTPKERWVTAFFDTNISFAALEAQGSVQGKTVTATMNARRVLAFGVKVDSLSSNHSFGPQGYVLKSSSLYTHNKTWSLTGNVKTARKPISLDFQATNPHYGSLEFFQQQDSMQVIAKQFQLDSFPYVPLARLPVQDPMLDGTFQWNQKHRTGAIDLKAMANYQQEKIQVAAKAHWDAQYLEAENLTLDFKTSSLRVAARIKTNGHQFYELSKLRIPDYEYVAVETPHFDLAHALSLFQPHPFLKSGQMLGELVYANSAGFKGSLVFSNLIPNEDIGDVVLKRLQLDGTGDSLIVLGVTQSASTPILRDSLRIGITQALQDTQHVHVEAMAGDSLHLELDGASSHFQALQGRLQIQGKAALPDNSGVLENLQTDMNFSIPFRNTLAQSVLTTQTFEGDYVIPSVTREHFSLNPELHAGTLNISQLSLKDSSGSALQGNAEYALSSRRLHAHLGGGDLTGQWTEDDKVALKNLNLDYSLDSSGTRLAGGFSQGTIRYVDIPLDAQGTLQDVTFAYTLPNTPPGHTGKRIPPSLTFSGALSQSLIRYSLKSLTAIQAVFQKERNKKRGGGRAQPIQLDVKLYTLGDSNRVDSDVLRMAWVGNLEMQGLYPFTLVEGRMNALNGELGLPNQAYQIQQLEVKWLDAPLEDGEVQMEARKNLATSCQKNSTPTDFAAQDSCAVIVQLHGPLSQLQFTYDSDCGGAFGAGANMVAILTSVERGCYDPSLSTGGGSGYGGTALSLLEPTLSQNLSTLLGRYSHSWIAETEITGLSSLAGGRDTVNDSVSQALSVEVTSKEFLHVRLQLKSGYHTESQDLSSPWENMLALEWRPPLDDYVEDPVWKERLHNHVSVTASVQTIAVERNEPEEDPVQKTLALSYLYDFWGRWWNKPKKLMPKKDTVKIEEKGP